MNQILEKSIFEYSRDGRGAEAQHPPALRGAASAASKEAMGAVPTALRRKHKPMLPEVSELDVVRHFTRLSQLNFSIDTNFYPLGSCR